MLATFCEVTKLHWHKKRRAIDESFQQMATHTRTNKNTSKAVLRGTEVRESNSSQGGKSEPAQAVRICGERQTAGEPVSERTEVSYSSW